MMVSRVHPCDSSQSSTAALVFRDFDVSPGGIVYVRRRGEEDTDSAAAAKERSKVGTYRRRDGAEQIFRDVALPQPVVDDNRVLAQNLDLGRIGLHPVARHGGLFTHAQRRRGTEGIWQLWRFVNE
jgi:hypothetical protein